MKHTFSEHSSSDPWDDLWEERVKNKADHETWVDDLEDDGLSTDLDEQD